MRLDSHSSLRRAGFDGFVTVAALLRRGIEQVPHCGGVYVVIRTPRVRKRFRRANPAGHFKGRDPTLSVRELTERWTPSARILYVGKAGGLGIRSSIHRRIGTYLQHGIGRPVAHWGGRAIWQLVDSAHLVIAWRRNSRSPRSDEKSLIDKLTSLYGRRPFANRAG